eukprot:199469-Pyramimonas_sp.AAC.1
MKMLGENEFAIELGGQTYSLSYEMHMANLAALFEDLSNSSMAAGRVASRIARKRQQVQEANSSNELK